MEPLGSYQQLQFRHRNTFRSLQMSHKADLNVSDADRICILSQGNIGALIIGIGFWGLLYYSSNKEPPKKTNIGNYYLGPYSKRLWASGLGLPGSGLRVDGLRL